MPPCKDKRDLRDQKETEEAMKTDPEREETEEITEETTEEAIEEEEEDRDRGLPSTLTPSQLCLWTNSEPTHKLSLVSIQAVVSESSKVAAVSSLSDQLYGKYM